MYQTLGEKLLEKLAERPICILECSLREIQRLNRFVEQGKVRLDNDSYYLVGKSARQLLDEELEREFWNGKWEDM